MNRRRRLVHWFTDNEIFEIKAQEYERGLKDAKPKVTEAFVEKQGKRLWTIKDVGLNCKGDCEGFINAILIEAGVEVED